jgi:hypothetical protein
MSLSGWASAYRRNGAEDIRFTNLVGLDPSRRCKPNIRYSRRPFRIGVLTLPPQVLGHLTLLAQQVHNASPMGHRNEKAKGEADEGNRSPALHEET